MTHHNTIEDVLRRHESSLLKKRYVTSVGIGEELDDRFIVVFVSEKLPREQLAPSDVIPDALEGYRVEVREQLQIG